MPTLRAGGLAIDYLSSLTDPVSPHHVPLNLTHSDSHLFHTKKAAVTAAFFPGGALHQASRRTSAASKLAEEINENRSLNQEVVNQQAGYFHRLAF